MRYPKKYSGKLLSYPWDSLAGGVDWRDPPFAISGKRLADCRNVWWERGALRARPGLYASVETAWQTDEPLGYDQKEVVLDFGAGDRREGWLGVRLEGTDSRFQASVIFTDRDGHPCQLGNSVTIYSQKRPAVLVIPYTAESLLMLNSSGSFYRLETPLSDQWTSLDDQVYYPLVITDAKGTDALDRPRTTGKAAEDYNLLTPYFRTQFTTDAESSLFFLPEDQLEQGASSVTLRWPDGESETLPFTREEDRAESSRGLYVFLNREQGCIYFNTTGVKDEYSAPSSLLGLRNNVEVLVRKIRSQGRGLISGMRLFTWFGGDRSAMRGGGRLFLAGNPSQPHVICWSDSGNPLYFPENNRAYAGDETQAITAFGRQGKYLILFKEREIYSVGYAAKAGTTNTSAFPMTQLHTSVGCDHPATVKLWRGRLTFVCRGSVYRLQSVGAGAAGAVRRISALLGDALSAAEAGTLSAGLYRDRYLLLNQDRVYVFGLDEREEPSVFPWEIKWEGLQWEGSLSSDRQMLLVGSGTDKQGEGFRLHCQWREGADCLPLPGWEDYGERPAACRIRTGWITLGDSDSPAVLHRFRLRVLSGADTELSLSLVTDRETVQFTLPAAGEGNEREQEEVWPLSPVSAGRVYWEIACLSPVVLIGGELNYFKRGVREK